jgi:hypothetical protein
MLRRSTTPPNPARAARLPTLLASLATVCAWPQAGCSESEDLSAGAPTASASAPLTDSPIAAERLALLELAFDSVTKMPAMPHVKDRSRAQEAVVETCLELDLPERAARYIPAIENWRRGTAWAALADYCAEHGDGAEARACLARAEEVAETPDDALPAAESPQSWRRDRIRARIARTHIRLGEMDKASLLEADLPEAERGEIESIRAERADAEACDAQLAAYEQICAVGGFEEVASCLDAGVALYGRFFADEARRSRIEALFEQAGRNVPRAVRIDCTLDLAEQALAHQDTERATTLIDKARALADEARWDLDDYTPIAARLAILRHQSGDAEGARGELDAAVGQLEQRRAELNSIRLARALRPLAEARARTGALPGALELYGLAVEVGADNPNARPRAEELSATCCSMARQGVAPGPELRARMDAIGAALDSPW